MHPGATPLTTHPPSWRAVYGGKMFPTVCRAFDLGIGFDGAIPSDDATESVWLAVAKSARTRPPRGGTASHGAAAGTMCCPGGPRVAPSDVATVVFIARQISTKPLHRGTLQQELAEIS